MRQRIAVAAGVLAMLCMFTAVTAGVINTGPPTSVGASVPQPSAQVTAFWQYMYGLEHMPSGYLGIVYDTDHVNAVVYAGSPIQAFLTCLFQQGTDLTFAISVNPPAEK